jgi:hypothetical protein
VLPKYFHGLEFFESKYFEAHGRGLSRFFFRVRFAMRANLGAAQNFQSNFEELRPREGGPIARRARAPKYFQGGIPMTAKKKAAPVSLRQAAAALDMSRKKLLRYIRQGLPCTRRDERVYIDLEAARAWIAANDLAGRSAPPLNPSDPRWREKRAVARLDWLRLALNSGVVVRREEALDRFSGELAELRGALLTIPRQFTPGEDLAGVGAALESALAVLKSDDARTWPEPRALAPMAEDEEESEDDAGHYAPMFRTSDPRHDFHTGKAMRAEAALEELESTVNTLADVLRESKRQNDLIRKRVRAIPSYLELSDPPDLGAEIMAALYELSDTEPDPQADASAVDWDSIPFDDVGETVKAQ